jgi:hypothetical protein
VNRAIFHLASGIENKPTDLVLLEEELDPAREAPDRTVLVAHHRLH